MKMCKKIFCFFVMFVGCFLLNYQHTVLFAAEKSIASQSDTVAKTEQINVESLSFYKFLLFAQNSFKQAEACSADIFSYDIRILMDIVYSFNTIYAQKHASLIPHFVKAFSGLQDVLFENLNPKLLRKQCENIEAFSRYIEVYSEQNRELLQSEETRFLSKILFFNQRMLDNLSQNFYLNFSTGKMALDWFVHRPIGFVKNHPYLISIVVILLVLVVLLTVFIVYKIYHKKSSEKLDEKKENKIFEGGINPEIEKKEEEEKEILKIDTKNNNKEFEEKQREERKKLIGECLSFIQYKNNEIDPNNPKDDEIDQLNDIENYFSWLTVLDGDEGKVVICNNSGWGGKFMAIFKSTETCNKFLKTFGLARSGESLIEI